jgi:hypothetical protein
LTKRVLAGKPDEKRPFGIPQCRGGNNIKRDLKEIGWEGVSWIDLAQERDSWLALVKAVINFRVP